MTRSIQLGLGLTAALVLPACRVNDDRVYGGGQVVVEIDSEDTGEAPQTWEVPGLDDDLSARGRSFDDGAEPDCDGPPGAWLWEDNGYPIELRGCGDGMWFVLEMGASVRQGGTVNAVDSGTTLLLAVESEDGEANSRGTSSRATVSVGPTGISGGYEDPEAEGLVLGPAAVSISWDMDPDIWVLRHR
jgi:hypothetical protein